MNLILTSGLANIDSILKLCMKTLGPGKIFAACLYGPRVYGYAGEKTEINVLLIMSHFSPKIRDFIIKTNSTMVSVLAIDRQAFETDVEKGKLGEVASEIISLPYQSCVNPSYLEEMEIRVKKRFVLELLENIILRYPELSTELLIEPEYFMYEIMNRRTKLLPSLIHVYSKLFRGDLRKRNIGSIMRLYSRALDELEKENCVASSDGYIKITKAFIQKTKSRRTPLSQISVSIQKAILPYIQDLSSKTIEFLQGQTLFRKSAQQRAEKELLKQLEESEKHLLMPTPLGPVPLSDKTDIQDFVRKTVPEGKTLDIAIDELGGVLNSVFVLCLQKDHETQRIVVKKFEDWLGFKWFPLALWTLGTQSFAVLGETRLEREYSINQLLKKNHILVPNILYVSPKERLIFEEFIEGEKASKIVKQIIASKSKENKNDREMIKSIGKEIAKVHSLGITLGDCKPENIVVTKDEKVCFLDLEQATENGNQPWDIAEFLYYSGHYFLPTNSDKAARALVSLFLEGYFEAAGKRENAKKAASAKYTKVFSIFALPHIILTMANTCKRMGEDRNE